MNEVKEQGLYCPYCGEYITVLIDCSEQQQSYIEDCQVCCRPITLNVQCDGGDEAVIEAYHENE